MLIDNANIETAENSHETTDGDIKEKPVMSRTVQFKGDDIGFDFAKLEIETIPLAKGSRVEVELAEVPLDAIRLDRENPRIQYALKALNISNPNQDELADLLWEDDDIKALKRSIQATGGLIEAIIINGSDGTVLEGNSRTVSLRKLAEEFPDDETWRTVRARILPAGISRDEISVLLGELHIAGKNEWTPFEQAAHLYDMNIRKGFALSELAEMFRMSKSSVQAKVKAYKLMREDYLPMAPAEDAPISKWSYFEEFIKICKPKADEAGRQLEDSFTKWVLENKFKVGAEVRYLKKILEDDEALAKFIEEDASAAWSVIEEDSPELGSKLFKSIVNATKALEAASLTEVEAVKNGDSARVRELKNLQAALKNFAAQSNTEI